MVVGALAAVSLLSVRSAAACGACSCNDDRDDPLVVLTGDLPLNFQAPVPVLAGSTASLVRRSDSLEIPSSLAPIAGSKGYALLKVEQDLEPNVEYALMSDGKVQQVFTTGASRDETAPTFSRVEVELGTNGGLCTQSVGARLQLRDVSDDSGGTARWVEIEVEIDGVVTTRFSTLGFSGIALGTSEMGCFGQTELPELKAGSSYAMRVRLHDVAGNVSDWHDLAFEPTAEEPGGCGPSMAGAGAGSGSGTTPGGDSSSCAFSPPRGGTGLLAALPLLLVGLRRRRQK
jgi:hypothetical protein